jgi:hypothetical protein
LFGSLSFFHCICHLTYKEAVMSFTDLLRNLRLPFSVISGPVIWVLQVGIGYVLVPVACQRNSNWIVLVISIVAAVPALVMGSIAYRSWRRYSTGTEQVSITSLDESEGLGAFFGSAGTLMSGLFFILIAATAFYSLFLSPCPVITMPFP